MTTKKRQLIFLIVNPLVALLLFFCIQKVYFLPGNDSTAFFYGPIIKHKLFGDTPKDILLINTHFDNQLVENLDEHGFPMGNLPIVDRQKLTTLFSKFTGSNAHKYIICDIIFDIPSKDDDSLSTVMKTVNHLIIPDYTNTLEPFADINSGLVDISTASGTFYKYRILNSKNKKKSIPLKVYEELNNTAIKPYALFSFLNGKMILNDFVPDPLFRSYNILESKELPVINLGDIIHLNPKTFQEFTADKIVVIGNYNSDNVGTIYGTTPGPLILLNAYYGLKNHNNVLSLPLLLILYIVFFAFSYHVCIPKPKLEAALTKLKLWGKLLELLSYALIMLIVGLLIYFCFGININLSYLALFFFLQSLFIHRIYYLKKLKEQFSLK